MITSRRTFITGLISFVAAPAIVRAGSLMPVKQMPDKAVFKIILPPYGWDPNVAMEWIDFDKVMQQIRIAYFLPPEYLK